MPTRTVSASPVVYSVHVHTAIYTHVAILYTMSPWTLHNSYEFYNPKGPGLQCPSAVRSLHVLRARGIIKSVEFIAQEVCITSLELTRGRWTRGITSSGSI